MEITVLVFAQIDGKYSDKTTNEGFITEPW